MRLSHVDGLYYLRWPMFGYFVKGELVVINVLTEDYASRFAGPKIIPEIQGAAKCIEERGLRWRIFLPLSQGCDIPADQPVFSPVASRNARNDAIVLALPNHGKVVSVSELVVGEVPSDAMHTQQQ